METAVSTIYDETHQKQFAAKNCDYKILWTGNYYWSIIL